MMRLQPDFARLTSGLPPSARRDALHALLDLPALAQVVAALGRNPDACPRVPDALALLFIIALGLFPGKSYRDVARQLLPGSAADRLPGRSTLCMARQRLGAEPVRLLARQALRPLADDSAPDAFYKGLRLLAIDGFTLAVPDSAANAAVLGYHGNQHGRSGYPAVRVVAVCEVATHAVLDWEVDAASASEGVVAGPLLGRLPAECLLLWDRHYFAFDRLWQACRAGGHVLGRLSKSVQPKLLRRLADGSYLAEVRSGHRSRFGTRARLRVRLLAYRIDDGSRGNPAAVHRLVTTLLDERLYPARELIELYHQRWEEEGTIDEIKTHQLGRPVLRSQTPEGVEQEVHGLLLAHYAVRRVMAEAARQAGVPPRRMGFTAALEVVRCRLAEARRGQGGLRRWYERVVREVAQEVIPPRRLRANGRVVKCPRQKWRAKRALPDKPPQPGKPFGEVVALVELLC
jgi:hypothetical protein